MSTFTAGGVTAPTQRLKKPDILDLVSNVDRMKCPMATSTSKGSAPEQDLFYWTMDIPLEEDNTGSPENQPWAAPVSQQTRDKLYNRVYNKITNLGVGEMAEQNKVLGTGGLSEFQYQLKMGLAQHLKSQESIFIGEQVSAEGNGLPMDGGGLGYMSQGAERYTDIDNTRQTDAATRTPAGYFPAGSTVFAHGSGMTQFSEQVLISAITAVATQMRSSVDMKGWCTLLFKNAVSSWGNLVQNTEGYTPLRRFEGGKDDKIKCIIDTWAGDAGTVEFDVHFGLRKRVTQLMDCLLSEKNAWMLRMKTNPYSEKLPKDGPRERGFIRSSGSLVLRHPWMVYKFETAAA